METNTKKEVKLIKTGKYNYFVSKDDPTERLEKYDPTNAENIGFVTRLPDGSLLNVDGSKIVEDYGGTISFEYDGVKYIIDDGYQNMLIKSGYIVMDSFDQIKIFDKAAGEEIRAENMERIRTAVREIFGYAHDGSIEITIMNSEELRLIIKTDNFKFTFIFNTVHKLVNKNNSRKVNNLPFYPFNKNMDNWGTIYTSIFCQRIEKNCEINDKYNYADDIISDIIYNMNENDDYENKYHYISNNVKHRINFCEGI
jgi:hypothetical protein